MATMTNRDPQRGAAQAGKLTLRAKTAADLMTAQVVSIDQSAPLRQAVARLVDRKFSAAPVIDEAGRTDGVVSMTTSSSMTAMPSPLPGLYRSITSNPTYKRRSATGWRVPGRSRRCHADSRRHDAGGVLGRPDTPARQVIEEMLQFRVHRLFVIDAAGMLVGVISMSDVLRRLLD